MHADPTWCTPPSFTRETNTAACCPRRSTLLTSPCQPDGSARGILSRRTSMQTMRTSQSQTVPRPTRPLQGACEAQACCMQPEHRELIGVLHATLSAHVPPPSSYVPNGEEEVQPSLGSRAYTLTTPAQWRGIMSRSCLRPTTSELPVPALRCCLPGPLTDHSLLHPQYWLHGEGSSSWPGLNQHVSRDPAAGAEARGGMRAQMLWATSTDLFTPLGRLYPPRRGPVPRKQALPNNPAPSHGPSARVHAGRSTRLD